jgi:hypothetical protein
MPNALGSVPSTTTKQNKLVAHAYNLSYFGGWDGDDYSSRLSQAKKFVEPPSQPLAECNCTHLPSQATRRLRSVSGQEFSHLENVCKWSSWGTWYSMLLLKYTKISDSQKESRYR